MNDKTSTPDDPDGRGSVATGEQASDDTVASNGATGPVSPAGRGSGSTPPVSDEGSSPEPEPATSVSGPGTTAQDAGQSSEAGRFPVGTDEPTTEMRLPSPNGSASRPDPGAPAVPTDDEVTVRVDLPSARSEQRPAPSPSARPPASAPGPVPGPGPAAAAPPPWQRVPGQESNDRWDTPVAERPAGGLLDVDGPTTFLDPPIRSGPEPQDPPAPDGSGWSAVRAVRNRPPRQAALQLKRLDPWSVLKLALVLAVVLFFIWLVAVGVLFGVLDGMGVWDRLNGTYADLVSGETLTGSPLISAGRVFGLAAVIGAINSLLFAVAVTIGAFVYNVSADLVGGIEVTLSERD